MTAKDNIEEKLEKLAQAVSCDEALVENVMGRIEAKPLGRASQMNKFKNKLITRRFIMNRFTKIAAAAVILIAIGLSVSIWDKSIPSASAAEVLAEAVEAMSELKSIYIKAQIRTIAHDNFVLIGLDYDFVPNEMWKEFDGSFHGKWRVEKPRRVVVMDGKSSVLLIRPNYGARGGPGTGMVGWLQELLDVDKIIDRQLQLARNLGWDLELIHEQGEDGHENLVVIVEAKAQGDFTNDYLRNKSICASDNRRIYTFDAETKLLEGLEVYVHTEHEDVLVLEITDITYNLELDPALFELELPDDMVWYEQPKRLAENEKYEQMTPKEVAQAFFQACADEDWDEFLKFWSATGVQQALKNYLGGLEIIYIGEPFKSGRYPGWFIPYEIKLKSGYVKKHNLAVRNDNPAKRYIVDGGI